MKTVNGNIVIEVEMNIKLFITKEEALALNAIAGYGVKEFLKCFYEHMGRAYLEPHEEAMITLFDKLKNQIPIEVSKIETAEKQIKGAVDLFKPINQ